MKDIIKEYADLVSVKNQELADKLGQEERERKTKQNQAFDVFKDQVKIDDFLSSICSLLDKDHSKVRISVLGRIIIPDDRYKEDSRYGHYWGYEQLRKPSFLERLRDSDYWNKCIISLVSEKGEVYQLLWSDHKSPVPLYVIENDGNFKKYYNKLIKFPIKELIQSYRGNEVGTLPIEGDEEITLIISNKKTEISYATKLSYSNIGLVLEHRFGDKWRVERTGMSVYKWTKAILKQERAENTFVDFLTKIFKEINLDFRVINSEIKDWSTQKLPLFEISLKENEEKGN